MTIDELVGENVRRARVSAGLSPHELAGRVTSLGLPLSEGALQNLEAGTDRLGVDALVAVGLALGLPPAALLAPLNLGSLLWMDAEGKPLASWALFQDDQRSFTRGPLPAPAPMETAPSMPPDPRPLQPVGVLATPQAVEVLSMAAAEPAAAPTTIELPVMSAAAVPQPAAGLPMPVGDAPLSTPPIPPGEAAAAPPPPAPPRPRASGRDRTWAMEALQSLLSPARD